MGIMGIMGLIGLMGPMRLIGPMTYGSYKLYASMFA